MTPSSLPKGCTLHLKDGSTLSLAETKTVATQKWQTKVWQTFLTKEGNQCRVNCSQITKIT